MSNYHKNTKIPPFDNAPLTLETVDIGETKHEQEIVYIGSAKPTVDKWEAYLEEKYQCELNFKRDQLATLNLKFSRKEICKNADLNAFIAEQNLEHKIEVQIAKIEKNIINARRQYHRFFTNCQ